MANKTDASTPSEIVIEQAVAFINDLEGTGYDSVDYIVDRLDNSDAAVVAWCKTELGNELDVEEAWDEVTAWCEKENVPLKGKYREICQKMTQEGIDGNNGNAWLADHETAVIRCALAESFDDGCRALLSEYGDCVHEMDMEGLPKVTNYQYLEAATEIVVLNAKQLVEKEGYKELFSWALQCDEGRLGNCQKLLKHFVEHHPEHKLTIVDALIDCDCLYLAEWLCTVDWYTGLEEAFTTRAKEIYKAACIGWGIEGDAVLNELSTVVRQALAKGGVGSDEILSDDAFKQLISDERQRREDEIEEGKRKYEEQQAELKAKQQSDAKQRAEEKDSRSNNDIFWDALNQAYFDEIFLNPDAFKDLILEHIEDIASNFCEGNEFEATSEEPQWLLSALLNAGAEFGGGGGGGSNDDA